MRLIFTSVFLVLILASGLNGQTSFLAHMSHDSASFKLHNAGDPIQCSDGGFMLTAIVAESDTIGANNHLMFIRLDSIGNVLWMKTYDNFIQVIGGNTIPIDSGFLFVGSSMSGILFSMRLDQNGDTIAVRNFINGGQSVKYDITNSGEFVSFGRTPISGVPTTGTGIRKLDSLGTIIWNQTFCVSGNNSSIPGSGIVCSDGGYLLVLPFTVLVKLSSTGAFMWQTPQYNFPTPFLAIDLVEMIDGSYLLVGGHSGGHPVAIRILPTGVVQSVYSFGDPSLYGLFHRAETFSDGYTRIFSNANTPTQQNIWVITVDTLMNVIDSKVYNPSPLANSVALYFSETNDGGVMIYGKYNDPSTNQPHLFFLVDNGSFSGCGVSAASNQKTLVTLPGPQTVTVLNPTIPVSQVNYPTINAINELFQDGYCLGTGINETGSLPEEEFSVYPNPVHSSTTVFISEKAGNGSLLMTDQLGKIIFEKEILQQETELDVSQFNPGIYFLQWSSKTGSRTRKVVVY